MESRAGTWRRSLQRASCWTGVQKSVVTFILSLPRETLFMWVANLPVQEAKSEVILRHSTPQANCWTGTRKAAIRWKLWPSMTARFSPEGSLVAPEAKLASVWRRLIAQAGGWIGALELIRQPASAIKRRQTLASLASGATK